MANYWQDRFVLLEKMQMNKGIEYYHELEKQYTKAANEVQKEISSWYSRLAKNNEISISEARKLLSDDELKEFKWTVEEYILKGRENDIDGRWMKELENASAKVHISRLEAMKLQMQQQVEVLYGNELDSFDEFMKKTYTEGFYRSAYEIQKGLGVGTNLAKLDPEKVNRIIAKPWAADGSNFSSRIWKQKNQLVNELQNGLSQAFIRGTEPYDLTKQIAERFKVSKGQAGRLVMTETAYFHSAAQIDAFKELGVKEYEITAVLDNKTSELCRDMDGKHLPVSEFKPGITAPPFHCWCRSTTVPYFNDEYTEEETRIARGNDGKLYEVPYNMTYRQWEKAFVDGDKSGLKPAKDIDIKQAVIDIPAETVIEKANRIANDALKDAYEYRRIEQGANFVPYADLADKSFVNLEGVADELAEASAEQFALLSKQYNTTCTKINVDKLDPMLSGVPAQTTPMSNIQQSTITFNKDVVKDYDKFKSRMKKAVERGQFPDMPEENYDKYVITHEFAHTLLETSAKNKNLVGIDMTNIKKAKKEIINLREQYMKEINALTAEYKATELKALETFDEADWKKAQELSKQLDEIKISKYADMNADEFMAEAFTDAKLGTNPSRYSKQVEEVFDKYLSKDVTASFEENIDDVLEQEVKITKKPKDRINGFSVDRELVNSKKYHDKFDEIELNKPTSEKAYIASKEILEKADGTNLEYTTVLDVRTGDEVLSTKNIDNAIANKVSLTEEQYNEVISHKGNVILMHNHPGSGRPSGTDIVTTYKVPNAVGSIVVGHDGTIYYIYDIKKNSNIDKIYQEYYDKHIREALNLSFDEDIPEQIDKQVVDKCKIKATTDLYNTNKGKGYFKIVRL